MSLHVFARQTSVACFPPLDIICMFSCARLHFHDFPALHISCMFSSAREMRFPLLPNLEILGSLRDDEDNGKDIVKQIVGHCKVIVTCIMLPK